MELSLETQHREDVLDFVNKTRVEYDRLLDEAPDIPAESINAFNEAFPDKENKPDVCNGLSVINYGEDTTSHKNMVLKNWLLKMRPGTPTTPRPSVELKSYNSEEEV